VSAARAEFEALLREALAPVEPPADLAQRLERTLASLTELAADELDAWELGAMRNPRNWVRPTAAAIVGSAAGTALVLVRVRQTHRRRRAVSRNPLDLARRTMGDAGREARRVLERLRR
jgi:hypothetical protein